MEHTNILYSNGMDKISVKHLYTVDDYLTINIHVKSGEFAGQSNFCIAKKRMGGILGSLKEMYNVLKGQCEIEDTDSDAHLIIEVDRLGHLVISGQIGGSHETHSMHFKLNSDQTLLERLIKLFSDYIR